MVSASLIRVLLDTNILLRLADQSDPLHATVFEAIEFLGVSGGSLFVVPQNLQEFWVVATRTVKANGLGLSLPHAERLVMQFTRTFHLLRDERSIHETWLELVKRHKVRGVQSFDTRLAAALKRHGLSHLLTLNAADFRRYEHFAVLSPKDLTQTTMPYG